MSRTEVMIPGSGDPAGELTRGVELRVFAGGRVGTQGLTTCKVTMQPQAMLAYHRHPCSEAVTALER